MRNTLAASNIPDRRQTGKALPCAAGSGSPTRAVFAWWAEDSRVAKAERQKEYSGFACWSESDLQQVRQEFKPRRISSGSERSDKNKRPRLFAAFLNYQTAAISFSCLFSWRRLFSLQPSSWRPSWPGAFLRSFTWRLSFWPLVFSWQLAFSWRPSFSSWLLRLRRCCVREQERLLEPELLRP